MQRKCIETCTTNLDGVSKVKIESDFGGLAIFLEDCTEMRVYKERDEFKAIRLYGSGELEYGYLQYIVGEDIQLVTRKGDCISANKKHPFPNKSKPMRSPIGGLLNLKPCPDVELSDYQKGVGPLSLFVLSVEHNYFDIVCLNTWCVTEYKEELAEFIETMGFYSKYPYKVGVRKHYLIVALNEAVYLRYFYSGSEARGDERYE